MKAPKQARKEIFSFCIMATRGSINRGVVAVSAPATEASVYLRATIDIQNPPKTTTNAANDISFIRRRRLRGATHTFSWRRTSQPTINPNTPKIRRMDAASIVGLDLTPTLARSTPTVVHTTAITPHLIPKDLFFTAPIEGVCSVMTHVSPVTV